MLAAAVAGNELLRLHRPGNRRALAALLSRRSRATLPGARRTRHLPVHRTAGHHRPARPDRPLLTEDPMTRLAVVTPSYAPDFDLCADLNRSVLAHAGDDVHHHIVVAARDLALFARLAGPRRRPPGVR